MQTEDQSEVIGFLEAASTHAGATVERIDTHASVVFLAGSRAWKLKRAVRYEFLDFSTAAPAARDVRGRAADQSTDVAGLVSGGDARSRAVPAARCSLAAPARPWTG